MKDNFLRSLTWKLLCCPRKKVFVLWKIYPLEIMQKHTWKPTKFVRACGVVLTHSNYSWVSCSMFLIFHLFSHIPITSTTSFHLSLWYMVSCKLMYGNLVCNYGIYIRHRNIDCCDSHSTMPVNQSQMWVSQITEFIFIFFAKSTK